MKYLRINLKIEFLNKRYTLQFLKWLISISYKFSIGFSLFKKNAKQMRILFSSYDKDGHIFHLKCFAYLRYIQKARKNTLDIYIFRIVIFKHISKF